MNNVVFKVRKKYQSYIENKMINSNLSFTVKTELNDFVFYETSEKEYQEITKLDYRKEVIFIKYTGYKNVIDVVMLNKEKIFISIMIIILVYLSRFLILKVNINTNDIDLKNQIKYALIDYKIEDFKIRKSYKKIEKIKKEILKKYNDKIEWLEIKRRGYYYDVLIIKREKNNVKAENDKCNYVAVKSGTITSIKASKGVLVVSENNYINKGDILIDGKIIYNEKIKAEVCAKGKIKGLVWYKINSKIPLKKEVKTYEKKHKYNIEINLFKKKYKLFKSKKKYTVSDRTYGNKMIGINIQKLSNKNKKNIEYTEKEAEEKLINLSKNKLLLKLNGDAKIIEQNILKKYTKNSTIYIELLVTVEEELGMVESYI